MAMPNPMIFRRSVCSAMKEKSEKSIILKYFIYSGTWITLTHESLDEERNGDDVEGEQIEDVLSVLLQEHSHPLPVLGQPRVGN